MNRKLLVLLALLAVAGIVAYRAFGGDFNWPLFFSSLGNVRPGWLAASVILTMLSYWFRATRWQILLGGLKPVPVSRLFSTNIVGFAAIYLLGRAGELVRPVWLTRREHVPLSATVATIIVERVLDMILLVAVFAWALLVTELPGASSSLLTELKARALWIAIPPPIAIVVLFIFRSNIRRIVGIIPFARLAVWAESFAQGLEFLSGGKSLVLVIFHSFLVWLMITMQFWFMMLGMNFDFPAGAATLVMVGAAIGSIVHIPAIGGGFQAGYVACMTAFLHVPAEQAVATALLATVFSYVPTIAAGALYMLAQGISLRDLKPAVANPESEIV